MTFENAKNLAPERIVESGSSYSAEISRDAELDSTVLSLFYKDSAQPERAISVSIAPDLGSNMFSFRVGEHNLLYCDRELLKRMDFTGNFVLWPFPNRIRDKRYTYQGHAYSLQDVRRAQGNSVLVHGLVMDQPWQFERPVVEENAVHVTTFVDINEEAPYYKAYPFESRLSLTYTLTKSGVTITYLVQNKGSKDLPFGFALHPYFSTFAGKQDTLVSIAADAVMEADDELLPTGRVFDVDKVMYAMYDVREPQPIGNLKLDHVYTNVNKHAPALIDYKNSGLQLLISTTQDFTHVVLFTLTGGNPYFCLEHQTCATDAINLHNQGSERQKMAHLLEVHPGESSTGTIQYALRF